MSREIKFRMWHEKSKKMYDVEKINIKDKLLNMWNSKFYSSSLFSFDEVELMQYIGRKDKNGVEIYEGDIVKVDGSSNNDAEINEVVFYRGAFCFTNRKEIYPLFTGLNYCCEVIGNIYENPELLKVGEE